MERRVSTAKKEREEGEKRADSTIGYPPKRLMRRH
jgi:hypothetical protein